MYGGLQMAIGLFALLGLLQPKYRDAALTFFVIALTGLSLSRLGGMIAEGDNSYLSFSTEITAGKYNQTGLAIYELPNMIFAWILFALRPRRSSTNDPEVLRAQLLKLSAENEELRTSFRNLPRQPR